MPASWWNRAWISYEALDVMNLEALSPEEILMKRRSLRRDLAAQPDLRPLRIAVLGGTTTNALVEILDLFLLSNGFATTFHQSDYGRFYEDAVHDPQALIDFRPDLVYVHTSSYNVAALPPGTAAEAIPGHVEAELSRFRAIWDSIDQKIGCTVIQNNFEVPPYALLGNMDATAHGGYTRFLARLNEGFADAACQRPKLLIQDIHSISAHVGLANWYDWERYFAYKVLLKPAANIAVARSLNALVGAIYGKSRKVLVLDLDNTLWGGVIGDDGVDKIKIGRETPVAEAYTAFQQYCLALRDRGILLAVCSKNNEDVARSGLEHPSSTIKLKDISCFKANWQPKHENIEQIARELNLGVDSFVFIDDNPAERAIVQAQLPSVAVPEVGSEVARFAAIIDAGRFFEPASLSKEDLERAALYASNAQRTAQQSQFANYGEYLDSLEMTAEIAPFQPIYLERIAQLTNKTNQWNLTTRRYSLADIERFAASPDYVGLYGILVDRFGDNGLISIALGYKRGDVVDLDLWLMSCRVLKRDMELAMLDGLARRAIALGAKTLHGTYLPTAKNGMVANHYEKLGFSPAPVAAGLPAGATCWTLDLAGYTDRNMHIKVHGG